MSVYFIRAGRYFKIGYSGDPRRRFEQLHQGTSRYTFPTGVPLEVEARELHRVIDGSKDRERTIHEALGQFSVGMEWFLDEPPVREFIATLPTVDDEAHLAPVARPGGPCRDEWAQVRDGRAFRELARLERRTA